MTNNNIHDNSAGGIQVSSEANPIFQLNQVHGHENGAGALDRASWCWALESAGPQCRPAQSEQGAGARFAATSQVDPPPPDHPLSPNIYFSAIFCDFRLCPSFDTVPGGSWMPGYRAPTSHTHRGPVVNL